MFADALSPPSERVRSMCMCMCVCVCAAQRTSQPDQFKTAKATDFKFDRHVTP